MATSSPSQETALHLAVRKGRQDCVKVILQAILDKRPDVLPDFVLAKTVSQKNALHLAVHVEEVLASPQPATSGAAKPPGETSGRTSQRRVLPMSCDSAVGADLASTSDEPSARDAAETTTSNPSER